jgi:transcriptional regulator with GAF, ATPase, and Fis domain
MDTFLDYSWPGNVRELENITERAVIIERFAPIQGDASLDFRDVESGAPPSSLKLKDVEYEHILRVLNETQWLIEGKGGAAVRLGMNASTLRSRMQKLGIRRPS